MIFNCKDNADKFVYDKQQIEVVTKFKYLGIVIDSTNKMCLSTTPNYLTEQARKATHTGVKLYCEAMGKLSPALSLKLAV